MPACRQATFLFLFPTKALAQDQLRVLRQLLEDAFGPDNAPRAEVGARGRHPACSLPAHACMHACMHQDCQRHQH